MRRPSGVLPALAGLLALCGPVRSAAPPARPEPLRGAVVAGHAIACTVERSAGTAWVQAPAGRRPKGTWLAIVGDVPLRWHAARGGLWIADCHDGINPPSHDWVRWYDLGELLKGRLVTEPGEDPIEWMGAGLAQAWPVWDLRFMGGVAKFRPVVDYDYLPAGRSELKLFVLTNVAGARSVEKAQGFTVRGFPNEQQKEPKWSFACHSMRARWDKDKGWDKSDWALECGIDLVFREPFQALARGEDYYFLTASGKLYRAPKPAKGKHRRLVAVWDEARSPIVAHVADADNGRTFLFCDRGRKGEGGPCVFELADGVRLRPYDPKLYKPGDQGPTALRKVVGYARVLQALGHVEETRAPNKDR